MAEKRQLPNPLDDGTTKTKGPFTYTCEIRSEITSTHTLCPPEVRSWVGFDADDHISHVILILSDKSNSVKLHHEAKLRVPAAAIQTMTLYKLSKEYLQAQGTWTAEIAASHLEHPNRFLWGLLLTFDAAKCSMEGIRVVTPSSDKLDDFRVHMGAAGNGMPARSLGRVSLYIVVKGGDLVQKDFDTLQNTFRATGNEEPIPITFKSQVSDSIHKVDKQVLLNNAPDLLPRIDLYADVSAEFGGQLTDGMVLDADQAEAILRCRNALGGWVLVQGPPGTGKTHVAVQIIRPFLITEQHSQVLLTSATNAGVDNMAIKADLLLQSLKQKGKALGKYVLGVHSPDAEKQATFRTAQQHRPSPCGSKPALRGKLNNEVDRAALQDVEAARNKHDLYLKARSTAHQDINDPRFLELRLSPGYRVLQVLGVILTDEDEIAIPSRFTLAGNLRVVDRFQGAIEVYSAYMANEEFDKPRTNTLYELLTIVRDEVFANAAAVVTTLSTAGAYHIYKSVKPSIIIVDDAGRAPEVDILPLIMNYPPTAGKVLIGDIMQLGLFVPSTKRDPRDHGPIFASQRQVSLLHRLQASDFGTIMLRTQYRAIPRIADIYSGITYGGELVHGNGTAEEERPLAGLIAAFNGATYQKALPILFFNLVHAEAETNDTGSQYNKMSAAFTMNLITELLGQDFMKDKTLGSKGKPRIAVLGCYQAQYLYHSAALENMAIAGVEGLDQVSFDKIDRLQGNEWDIVIIDLTVTDRLGFLRDATRLNVLWSRARTALYIVGNKNAMDNINDRQVKSLKDFYGDCLKYRRDIKEAEILCPFIGFNTVEFANAEEDE